MKTMLKWLFGFAVVAAMFTGSGCGRKTDDEDAGSDRSESKSSTEVVCFTADGNVLELEFENTTNGWRCTKSDADILSEEFFNGICECWHWSRGFELRIKLPGEFPFLLRQAMLATLFQIGIYTKMFYCLDGHIFYGGVSMPGGIEGFKCKNLGDLVAHYRRMYEKNHCVDRIPLQASNIVDDSSDCRTIFVQKGAEESVTMGDYLRTLAENGIIGEFHVSVFSQFGEYTFIENVREVTEEDIALPIQH